MGSVSIDRPFTRLADILKRRRMISRRFFYHSSMGPNRIKISKSWDAARKTDGKSHETSVGKKLNNVLTGC